MVHVLDIFPAVQQSQGSSLLFQIGVLPAGHLVYIDFRIGEVLCLVRCFVIRTYSLPVMGHFIQRIHIQLGLAGMSFQSIIQTGCGWLGGPVTHGAHGHVHDIYSCIYSAGICINGVAAAFVTVQMDGY